MKDVPRREKNSHHNNLFLRKDAFSVRSPLGTHVMRAERKSEELRFGGNYFFLDDHVIQGKLLFKVNTGQLFYC